MEYFVSYYDYYQPEAYVPGKDLYIEKDASINQEIERMRLSATTSLMERRDVIVVATVSCIYGLGNPEDYREMRIELKKGDTEDMRELMRRLVSLQYERNDAVFERSRFRVRGDVLEIFPSYAREAVRVEFFGDEIERIRRIDPLSGATVEELEFVTVYPAKYFVMPQERLRNALRLIRDELATMRYKQFCDEGKLLEAERIKTRTEYDLEMLEEMGYCSGIENYSRHLSGRKEGERPAVLLDFFPQKFLAFVDESHVTLPQVRGMYEGDRARKLSLVKYGFRLPSALDNRPLVLQRVRDHAGRVIFVSATPGEEEAAKSRQLAEQVIRPTGLLDPMLEVRPTEGQMEDLYARDHRRRWRRERTLVTTLTKRMAEDLTDYLGELGLKVRYLHSEIETIERVEILRDLRMGDIRRAGRASTSCARAWTCPEVSLIAILDADKIGFLRSATSLIQTIGRAARNVNGRVIMYADRMSDAMQLAIEETDAPAAHPGALQHGARHHADDHLQVHPGHPRAQAGGEAQIGGDRTSRCSRRSYNVLVPKEKKQLIRALEEEMFELAKNLEFERAAVVRDEIRKIKEMSPT